MSESIHPQTRMGRVYLTVADLQRSLDYYQDGIGLKRLRQDGDWTYLGAGDTELVVLKENPGAMPARHTTGLYHFALLVPSRLELARTLQHLIDSETPVGGWSDHAVSEALYLRDPNGHGIEIYRDRPRSKWAYPGGALKITVDPFDAKGVLGELSGDEPEWTGIHPGTVMGHVHLHVAHLAPTLAFYVDTLGFELMARYGQQAGFVAAGGYHHHLGLNTWAGVGAPPPGDDLARLERYEIVLPETAVLHELAQRLQQSSIQLDQHDNGYALSDPSHNRIVLTTASSS